MHVLSNFRLEGRGLFGGRRRCGRLERTRTVKTLTVVVAGDSFKGSATSAEVADAVERGIRRVVPECEVRKLAIADGGEGTVDAVAPVCGAVVREVTVQGPLGEPVAARYVLLVSGTAVIEMAQAAGLTLVEQTEAHALAASTFGVGQLIADALDQGVRRIYVGLGGSATSDGGMGMVRALGARFLDREGAPVAEGLAGLEQLAAVDCSGLDPRLEDAEVVALTDVSNPLTGPSGAVSVYGPQKGLPCERLVELDGWMSSYAHLLEKACGRSVEKAPGAGAAGGTGAALLAFCSARVERGIDTVLDLVGLDAALDGADLVITGEGRMDEQSAYGKAPVGVAARAKARGLPVVAVVGSRSEELDAIYQAGIDLVVPLPLGPMSLETCMGRARELLEHAGETAMRAFLLGGRPFFASA